MVCVELTKENGCRMGGEEAWRGRDPCVGRGGKAKVYRARGEKGEKTIYLGLERGRKEQSSRRERVKEQVEEPQICAIRVHQRNRKSRIWKHRAPDGTCFSKASPVHISCLGSECKFQGPAFHF